jgi:hypothetical protein
MTIEERIIVLREVYHVFEWALEKHADSDPYASDADYVLQKAFIKLCECESVPIDMMIRELGLTYDKYGHLSGWMSKDWMKEK